MQIIYDIETMRTVIAQIKEKKLNIGFVPTMGALHEGHLALIKNAKAKSDVVIVSIFVNQKQFDNENDFVNYPKKLEEDSDFLHKAGVNYLFCPSNEEMWESDTETIVETTKLANILVGKVRPGHFRGVTTIVAKLFNIIEPTYAFFGEKDFQQLAIIKKMVKDLNFKVNIIGVAMVREKDGVAYSSRNSLLTFEERQAAQILSQALFSGQQEFESGMKQVEDLRAYLKTFISQEKLASIELIDILDANSLEVAEGYLHAGMVILLFVRFGSVQLIDQHILR